VYERHLGLSHLHYAVIGTLIYPTLEKRLLESKGHVRGIWMRGTAHPRLEEEEEDKRD
jgi:hypothetical protein